MIGNGVTTARWEEVCRNTSLGFSDDVGKENAVKVNRTSHFHPSGVGHNKPHWDFLFRCWDHVFKCSCGLKKLWEISNSMKWFVFKSDVFFQKIDLNKLQFRLETRFQQCWNEDGEKGDCGSASPQSPISLPWGTNCSQCVYLFLWRYSTQKSSLFIQTAGCAVHCFCHAFP